MSQEPKSPETPSRPDATPSSQPGVAASPAAGSAVPPRPTAGPPPMVKEWYVGREGQQYGPLDISQIVAGVQSGQIRPTDLCWKNGMASWVAVESIPEIARLMRRGQTAEMIQEGMKEGVKKAKEATYTAFGAFKLFALNPMAGLPAAYQAVGKAGALSAGIVFLVAYELVWLLYMLGGLHSLRSLGAGGGGVSVADLFRMIIVLAVPFAAVSLSLMAVRMIARSLETFHADVFVGGTVVLVFGVLGLIPLVFGGLNVEIILAAMVFGLCYTVLLLFSAVSRIYLISEAKAVWCVPVILLVAAWLSSILSRALIPKMMGFPFGGGLM